MTSGGDAWSDVVGEADESLRELWNDLEPAGCLEGERLGLHRLFGHRPAGLDEPYSFEPPDGRPGDPDQYELVLRVTFDDAAGFAWGTNRGNVVAHRDDLAAGALQHALVVGTNP